MVKMWADGREEPGGNRFSTSVGRGTMTGYHADILGVDDPLNPQQAASEVELASANYWMEHTLPTRKTDKEVSTTILIMQRLHQDDPTSRMLKQKGKRVRHICLPGESINYGDEVKPQSLKKFYVNGLLDSNRMGQEVLNDLEAVLGQFGFAGQIGQKPVPPGGALFKVEFLQIQDSIDVGQIAQVIRYWDKAATQDAGKYTAGVKMCRLKSGKFVVMDVVRGRWATERREAHMRATAEADGMRVRIHIEQEPASAGVDSVKASIKNLAGYAAYADRPTGDKVVRADPYSVQVNIGNVILLRGIWNTSYIEELRFFPFGTFKDQIDASSGAFNLLAQKKFARSLRSKRSA